MKSTEKIEVVIRGIGAIGPGFNSWQELRERLTSNSLDLSQKTQLPSLDILPPAERRRASPIIKAGLSAGLDACTDAQLQAKDLRTIFTSSGGDGANCIAICKQLATDDPLISPTRFHNSVHNTVAGYWGIATGCMHPSQVISAEDGSFAAGLMEASAQTLGSGLPSLLVSYDTSYPEPLNTFRQISDTAAIGLILDVPSYHNAKYPKIQISIRSCGIDDKEHAYSTSIPTLYSLALLNAFVANAKKTIFLPLHPHHHLAVKIV